jgi:hypothetical protein
MPHNKFWENKVWHHLVHERLGEVLLYYLAQVRPFNLKKTREELNRLIEEKRLGSIRVFPIFGPDDLLIRAWIHPSEENEFRQWLDDSLEGCRALIPFRVTQVYKRWYSSDGPQTLDRSLMDVINSRTVREVQSNQNPELLERLILNKLVIKRDVPNLSAIRFFVAIEIEEDRRALKQEVAKEVDQFLSTNVDIKNHSIYSGYGLCSALVKGQVENFFVIANLVNWIAERFEALGATTETYLVHDPGHIVGDETIGEATFSAISGRNLFIQSVIPEIYEMHYAKAETVKRFLQDIEGKDELSIDLSERGKQFLHDFLIGYLGDEPTVMAQTVFIFFFELENYLRSNYEKFINFASPPIKEIYAAAGVNKESSKFLSLGDLLKMYSMSLERSEKLQTRVRLENWQRLAQIRNSLAHGDLDLEKNWTATLSDLLAQFSRIYALIAVIEEVTNCKFTGSY